MPLNNDLNQSFGVITLTQALTYSVNTVFAQVAVSLGIATMTDYMKRFGFYAKPPLDFPASEMDSSKPYGAHGPLTRRAAATSTSAASPSARADCSSRRCRWPWWWPRWPTAAS